MIRIIIIILLLNNQLINNKPKDGLGVKASSQTALHYFKIAAANDVAEAQVMSGKILHYGIGVPQDCNLAVEYYKKVASKAPFSSLYSLALSHYKSGDIKRSLHLYKKLAQFGWEIAQANVAYIYAENLLENRSVVTSSSSLSVLSEEEINRRFEESLKYYLLTTSNYPKANLFIGDYFYYGKGNIAVDKQTAAAFYSSAISLPQAKFNIAYLHHFGEGVKKDLKQAWKFYNLCLLDEPNSLIVIVISLTKLFFDSFIEFVDKSKVSFAYSIFVFPSFVAQFFG